MIDSRRIEVIDDDVARILRTKTPAERLAIADGLWRSARRLIEASLRHRFPEWTEEQVRREVVRRMSHGAV